VLPARSEGAIFQTARSSGKFQGVIAAITLRGRVAEGVRNLAAEPQGFRDREGTLAVEPLPQGLPRHVRHHEVEGRFTDAARVEHRQDVRVLEPGRDLDLAEEPLRPQRQPQLGPEHLHRNLPVMAKVLGEVDGRHAPLPELALQRVPLPERLVEGGEGREGGGHGPLVRSSHSSPRPGCCQLGHQTSRSRYPYS
jgi:plasmid stabilization system protein ParE